jgi:hypothetical protein
MQIDSTAKAAEKPSAKGEFEMEQNLIFSQSDSLRIFTFIGSKGEEKLSLKCEFNLHDQIVDMIIVPTDQFKNE